MFKNWKQEMSQILVCYPYNTLLLYEKNKTLDVYKWANKFFAIKRLQHEY